MGHYDKHYEAAEEERRQAAAKLKEPIVKEFEDAVRKLEQLPQSGSHDIAIVYAQTALLWLKR